MLLSLALALGWWLSLRRRPRPAAAPAAPAAPAPDAPEIKATLRGGDLQGFVRALCAAAPVGVPGTLHALAQVLQDPAQRQALLRLERHLYAADADPAPAVLADLRRAFARGPAWPVRAARAQRAESAPYPPLYG